MKNHTITLEDLDAGLNNDILIASQTIGTKRKALYYNALKRVYTLDLTGEMPINETYKQGAIELYNNTIL